MNGRVVAFFVLRGESAADQLVRLVLNSHIEWESGAENELILNLFLHFLRPLGSLKVSSILYFYLFLIIQLHFFVDGMYTYSHLSSVVRFLDVLKLS